MPIATEKAEPTSEETLNAIRKILNSDDEDRETTDHRIANIKVLVSIEHIPVRSRRARLSWREEVVPTQIRKRPASDFTTAFRITARDCGHPVEVLTEGGNLWWPVGSDEHDAGRFLAGLRSGYPTIVGLIGARIRDTYKGHQSGEVQSRETIHDYRNEMVARAHHAATTSSSSTDAPTSAEADRSCRSTDLRSRPMDASCIPSTRGSSSAAPSRSD